MRADRLLSLLSLLQVHGRLSATDLARRLEVSTRTVYRDIEALSASGVPVYTEQGRRGGCVLLPGYRTDVSGLTSAEARALFTFTGRGLGMDADLKAALRKLLAQLPEPQRPEALHAQSSVVVDPRGWRRAADQTPHLDTVQTVVRQGKRLRMNYRGSERTVDPYGLVAKAGVWYLIAATNSEPRLYRVSRIEHAEPLDEPATRPAGLDLEALWEQLRNRFENRGTSTRVALRVREETAERLVRVCTTQLAEPAPELPAPQDGWVHLELSFVAEPAAAAALAGFGAAVVVREPASLRARLCVIGAELIAEYQE